VYRNTLVGNLSIVLHFMLYLRMLMWTLLLVCTGLAVAPVKAVFPQGAELESGSAQAGKCRRLNPSAPIVLLVGLLCAVAEYPGFLPRGAYRCGAQDAPRWSADARGGSPVALALIRRSSREAQAAGLGQPVALRTPVGH
jgi:hypothetical protein